MYAYLDSLINNLDFADNLLNELNEAYQEDPSAFFIIFKECLVNYAQEGKLVEIGVLPEILITEGPARPLEFPAVETINNKYACIPIYRAIFIDALKLPDLDVTAPLDMNIDDSNVDDFFCRGVEIQENVVLTSESLTKIGRGAFANCQTLRTIVINAPNLQSIGAFFAADCLKLMSVKINGSEKLNAIDHGFLSGCRDLRELILNGGERIGEIREGFLYGCRELSALHMPRVRKTLAVPFDFEPANYRNIKSITGPFSGILV